ncbi:hypothetical protein LTR62_004259 [Meristemomyces frigidus]|uniref:WLM-domain-containing protein n=1 Tax=Meristemomyces frigidus TaxID=1508187 RepID=A0AAN7TIV9_9PEZI|nr:hypothetical protein LTR62_004259 [Meristemomyces frigidus]
MVEPSYTGRNRTAARGGPSGVRRSYASEFRETEALFNSYEHLQGLQRGDAALKMLRQVASLVKPIMRKRGWHVQILAEFLPAEQNLLGLNINRGYKICIRLRYHLNPDLFMPIEEVVDTMLHELSHNVWGDHDSNFHRLWDELRDEHETLIRKGYTGEGFLSEGHRVGGGGRHGIPPPHDMRRLARASAENRQSRGTLSKGSGQRLGGTPLHAHGGDVRSVIANTVVRRNTIDRGCASGRQDAGALAEQAASNTFRTKAEEDDANDRAIAQALFELMEQEEERKIRNGTFSAAPTDGGLAWDSEKGLYDASKSVTSPVSPQQPDEEEQMKWAMEASLASQQHDVDPSHGLSPVSPISPEHPRLNTISEISAPRNPISGTRLSTLGLTSTKSALPDRGLLPSTTEDTVETANPRSSSLPLAGVPPLTHQKQTLQIPIAMDISDPFNPDEWSCNICTCINPMQHLACDACGSERPQLSGRTGASTEARSSTRTKTVAATTKPRWTLPKEAQSTSMGWNCGRCGAWHEHKWWTCSGCGLMKDTS